MDEAANSINNNTRAIRQDINLYVAKKATDIQKQVISTLFNKNLVNLSLKVGIPEGGKGNLVDFFV